MLRLSWICLEEDTLLRLSWICLEEDKLLSLSWICLEEDKLLRLSWICFDHSSNAAVNFTLFVVFCNFKKVCNEKFNCGE